MDGDGDRVGGLIGFNGQTVSNCSFSGTISDDGDGSNYYGGLIGYNSGSIQDSYTSVSMSGNWYTGGLVGSNEGGTINRCYSSTSSENSVFGSYYVGGLVGKISNSGLITESYSTATVVGYVNIAGGLVGDNNGSTINNCYSRGSVTRSQDNNSDFGSFIGKNEYSTVVTYCYSTGAVIYQNTNDPTDKGFVGNYSATGCSNNIFDSETSRQNGGSGATAKTTSEMKTTSTYTGESWDFSGTTGGTDYYWERDDTKNGGYPYLWWQTFPRSLVFTDGSAYTSSPTVGETNQPLGRFSLVSDATGAILDGVWITLNGTRTGATNFKLWQSSDDSFDSGSDSSIGSVVTDDPGNGGDIWFLNLSYAIGIIEDYFFVTCDLAADATGSIRGEIGGNKDIFTEFGTINSEISNAYLSGDDVPLPVTLSSFTGAWENHLPTLYWTTQSETENQGWNVYRSQDQEGMATGNYLQISSDLIPGMGTTSTPTDYTFTDDQTLAAGCYYYWIESVSYSNELELFGPVEIEVLGNLLPESPLNSFLNKNYPNPFNPTTTIEFGIEAGETGTLTIFNVIGQKIRTMTFSEGYHEYVWEAENQASGVYFLSFADAFLFSNQQDDDAQII